MFLGYYLKKNKKFINGENFNVGPNIKSNASVEVLINKILKIYNYNIKVNYNKKKKFAETARLNLNTSKIQKKIGWKSKLNFNQTCYFICEWYNKYFKSKNKLLEFTQLQMKKYINS